MSTKTNNQPASYLERLKIQQEKLKAKIVAVESREKSKLRKQDTRKKILVGSYFLDKASKDNTLPDLIKELDSYLTRDSDRILFNLPPLTKK